MYITTCSKDMNFCHLHEIYPRDMGKNSASERGLHAAKTAFKLNFTKPLKQQE